MEAVVKGTLGKVKVGDEELTITRFRGHKAILAGALIKRVMSQTPTITKNMNEFRKDFRENNFFEVTRDMVLLPRFQEMYGLRIEDFDGRKGEPIRLPENPDTQAIMMNIFPELFDLAKTEVITLLALIVVPDKELERADEADQIDELLQRRGKELLREGYIEELLELTVVAWEVLQDQIVSKRERLGKLRDLPFLGQMLSTSEQSPDSETEMPQTSQPEQPTSSTDSPDSTDGVESTPSTESPGTSSLSSSSLTSVS